MDGNERQMITGLFDRMRAVGPIEKDRDAEALIGQAVRQQPDAAYMLVQSVLVQEHALQQAGARIEELEQRVRQLETQSQRAPAAASGGFLGGLFGSGGRPQQSAVPSFGASRPAGPMAAQPGRSPWSQAPAGQPGMAQPAGGGFMRSAMATAAGVAGGMLVAGAISNMLSGSPASAAGSDTAAAGAPDPAADATTYDHSDNDPGVQDAGYDAGGGDWGGDMDI